MFGQTALILILALWSTEGATYVKPQNSGTTVNVLVDIVLSRFKNMAIKKELDPMSMPNFNKTFSKKLLILTVKAEVGFKNGILKGLSTLKRTGDCKLETKKDNSTYIEADFGLKSLNAKYDGYVKAMLMDLSIKVVAEIKDVRIVVKLQQKPGNDTHPVLKDFDIVDIDANITVDGLGPVDWLINPLIRLLKFLFKSEIVNILEDQVKKLLETLLVKFHLPF